MNERILKFAKEAGLKGKSEEALSPVELRFAKLIIQECANRATWAQDTNEEDIGKEVLKHFGVEA